MFQFLPGDKAQKFSAQYCSTADSSTALYLSLASALQPALRLRYTNYELIIIIIWILVAMLGMRVKYTIYIEIVKSD